MARWSFRVADLRTNVIIGELPVTGVRMSKVLNGSGQFEAEINLGDPRVQGLPLHAMTRPAIRSFYGVRDNTPLWGGIIWATDYDSERPSMRLVGADFASYFDHRKIVEVLPAPPIAKTYVAGLSRVYTQQDQNAIARDLVTLAQSHTAGNIGITFASTTNSGVPLDRAYHGWEQWYVGEVLRDLASLPTGPDFAFDVTGPDSQGRPIRVLRLGTPRLTQAGTAHRWDLGGNLLSYAWRSGGGAMATRVFFEGDGSERGARIAVSEDTSLYANGWPLLETDEIDTAVADDTQLQAKADGLQQALRLPTVTVDLRVHGDIPPLLGEYAPGDEGRAIIPAGDWLFPDGRDIAVRIASMELAVGDEGQETIVLSCRVIGQDVS